MQPDYGRLHQELRRKGMTLMLLWEERRADYADCQTYGYTQFCENYRRFAKQLKRSMRQVHRAGDKLFIDYAGPTIDLTDRSRAHIFVAALGASSYTLGLLSLAKRYGKVRLEAACIPALQIGACQYRHVRDILTNNRDQSAPANTSEWVSPDQPTSEDLATTNEERRDDDAHHPGSTALAETGRSGGRP